MAAGAVATIRCVKSVLTGEWLIDCTTARQRRVVNYWLTIVWIILIPISFLTGWAYLVSFVTLLSLIALVLGSFSAWAAETPVEKEGQ